MENKKELFKKILIILLCLIIIIFSFFYYKKQSEEFLEYDVKNFEDNFTENDNIIIEEKMINETNFELEKIKIYITGEVNSPGVKELENGARIEDAINIAGGITSLANLSQVNLAYPLEDGQKIYIPNINEKIEEYVIENNGEGIVETVNAKSSGRININVADVNELCNLPGVGESLAKRIIAYREENGKFQKIEDLKNVSGIGEKKYESLSEYIVVK